jgi:hypothetical protein
VATRWSSSPTSPPRSDWARSPGHADRLGGLFFAVTGHANHDYRSLKLSDFKAVGDRRTEVIEFNLAKSGKLWLDAETGLPLKLVAENREGLGIVETYRKWVLDGTFALPSGLKAGGVLPPAK